MYGLVISCVTIYAECFKIQMILEIPFLLPHLFRIKRATLSLHMHQIIVEFQMNL